MSILHGFSSAIRKKKEKVQTIKQTNEVEGVRKEFHVKQEGGNKQRKDKMKERTIERTEQNV